MTTDLLAPYRRSGAAATVAPPPRTEPPEFSGYRAYGVTEGGAKPSWLELRTGDGVTIARAYSGLVEIAYDRVEYTGLVLLFPGKLIRITGRHLRPVADSLLAGTCHYLAERAQGEACEQGAPVIDRIEIGSQAKASAPGEDD